ncbi:MAG TPA: hypothetical protein ENI23_06365 [bacterium]|nr:hypothetical protein [bacterium]
MRVIFCDYCHNPQAPNVVSIIFGYDSCGDIYCSAKLTIRASIERYRLPYSALIPAEQQVKEAEKLIA